jgi:hypothetical protein
LATLQHFSNMPLLLQEKQTGQRSACNCDRIGLAVSEVISAISFDVAVFEMSKNECHPCDVAILAGACGDVLECASAAGDQGESAFSVAARRVQQSIAGMSAEIKFRSLYGLHDRHVEADARGLVVGSAGRAIWSQPPSTARAEY